MSRQIKSDARCLISEKKCFGYSYKSGARHPHICKFVHHCCCSQLISAREDMVEFELREYNSRTI